MMLFFLSVRNLVLQRKRYTMIGLAVLIGFLLITVISGAAYGAMETVKAKASRYFAGHVSITGYTDGLQRLKDPEAVINAIERSKLHIRTVARRTIYYKNDASLFFGGETVRQRRLVGIDFQAEQRELANLDFSQGSVQAMLGETGYDGILISSSAASILSARVGDDVNLYLTSDTGQYNTATLVVRGIFNETSLFGYVAYMRNEDLNRLLLREHGEATDIAVYADSGTNPTVLAEELRIFLSQDFPVYPALPTKDALYAALAHSGNSLAVLSLDAHLAQIKSILDAFLIITYFVLAVFVLIVMVGILNTYRVIVYERTREIGTMRALGMGRRNVSVLFLFEALELSIIASTGGLIIGVALLQIVGFLDMGAIPAAGMFTDKGHLGFYLDPRIVGLNFAIMVGGVVAAALGPARKAAAIRPVDALRSEA